MLEAGRLKREIRRELNVKPKMSFGSTGVLDVMVDGKTVFSKQTARRNPQPGEIVKLIQAQAQTQTQ